MRWAAVVVDPAKLDNGEAFRESVRQVMDEHDWDGLPAVRAPA
jgi:hypothetical protein